MEIIKNNTVDYSYLSDYQVKDEIVRLERLRRLESEENEREIRLKEDKKIYNLSLKEIFKNLMNYMVEMINEITKFIETPNKDYNNLITILTREDRLIYLGLVIIIISMVLYFISGTN
jgi:phosphate uptake regulator